MTLADGSLVKLAPRSSLRIDFADARRFIRMQEGKAYFEVAKDPQRSFVVSTDILRVRAVGTRFEISVSPTKDEVTVTVKEGRVAVSRERESAAGRASDVAGSLPVEGGQQAKASADSPMVVEHVDVERELGWAQKVLTFDGEPLAEAVQQFNQLNRVQIVLDEELAERQVRGVFIADDPESFALVLSHMAPAVLERSPDVLRLKARAARTRQR